MTSQRSQAYGRVTRTLAEVGPAKLQPAEQDLLREAADALLFCEDIHDKAGEGALHDIRALLEHLVASGRWTQESADRLAEDLAACGPIAPVS